MFKNGTKSCFPEISLYKNAIKKAGFFEYYYYYVIAVITASPYL